MEELLGKISSYNIFNNLIPGAVLVALLDISGVYSFELKSIVIELSVYYFIGMSVSRVGSIAVEPILKRLRIIEPTSYIDYINASVIDTNIELLSESNNLYRTITATLSIFLLIFFAFKIKYYLDAPSNWIIIPSIFTFLLLFTAAYRKQSAYIRSRVTAINNRSRQ